MKYICSCKIEDKSLANIVKAESKKEAINKFCNHIRSKVGYVNPIKICCSNVEELIVI